MVDTRVTSSISYATYTMPVFKKTACALLSGRAGVGKTSLSVILKEEFKNYNLNVERFSFAGKVKEVADYMNWDGKKDERGRKLLQSVGRIGREYDKDTWCRLLFEEVIPLWNYYPYDVIVIDDWRFRNEYDFVAGNYLYHPFTARIDAPNRECLKGKLTYNDLSEMELDDFDFDLVIDNSEDGLELLRDKSQELIKMVLQTTPQM